MTTTTTIIVERHDAATDSENEVELTITGECYGGLKGRKNHPMDRFCPPDDEEGVEVLTVRDERGVEIEINATELRRAEDALIRAMIEARDDYAADRADSIRSRYRDDLAR